MRTQEINKEVIQYWYENRDLHPSECTASKIDWGQEQAEKGAEVKALTAERGFNGL